MKRHLLLLALLIAGCGQDETTPSGSGSGPKTGLGNIQPAMAAQVDGPRIPAEARYTIFCASDSTTNHVANTQRALDTLVSMTKPMGMKDWYVVQGDAQSSLQYGYYKTIDPAEDKAEAERARKDHKVIAGMVDKATGAKLFQLCALVPLNNTDVAVGPPEWNLENAKGYWSIEVASFQTGPERKQKAVEAVIEARKEGIEAYYFHGASISSVCIGTWPKSAIVQHGADDHTALPLAGGNSVKAAKPSDDPNQPLFVMGNGMSMSKEQINGIREDQLNGVQNPQNRTLHVVQATWEVTDPALKATILKYPTHPVDGWDRYDKLTNSYPDHSFVVQIPHKGAQLEQAVPEPTLDPGLIMPTQPQPSRLRSINDGN